MVDEESLVVVHSTHHNFPQGPPSNPLELSGVPWVGFPTGKGSSGEPFARILTQQLARAGLTTPEIITIDSLTAQKRLIEADLGFGLLPEGSVQEKLELPEYSEGFNKLYYVSIGEEGFKTEGWKNEV